MQNPKKERNDAVCIHDVIYPIVILLPLKETLNKTERYEAGHYIINYLNQPLHNKLSEPDSVKIP